MEIVQIDSHCSVHRKNKITSHSARPVAHVAQQPELVLLLKLCSWNRSGHVGECVCVVRLSAVSSCKRGFLGFGSVHATAAPCLPASPLQPCQSLPEDFVSPQAFSFMLVFSATALSSSVVEGLAGHSRSFKISPKSPKV